MLANHNKFDLGMKQSGVALNDVVLPPRAKDDALEFIRVHRAALECDYVSQHLHE
jgi:WD repeat and FYVE domain-containing protein 3